MDKRNRKWTNPWPLYLFIGASGCGKDSIVDCLVQTMRLVSVQSYTTRPPRSDADTSHVFVSEDYFDDLLAVGQMAATTTYGSFRYGATWAQVERGDLYIIDPAGAASLDRERLGRPVYEVLITASEPARRQRMMLRGDAEKDIAQRIERDNKIFGAYRSGSTWDHIVDTTFQPPALAAGGIASFVIWNWPYDRGADTLPDA